MNYGMRFVTLYRRQRSRPSLWEKKCKKAKWLSREVKELGSFEYELLFSLLGTCSKHCSFLHYNLVSINQLDNEAGKENEVQFGNTFIFDVIPVFSGSQSKHHALV